MIDVVPVDRDFSALHQRMGWYVGQGILPCVATLVLRGTDVVDAGWFGWMDMEAERPLGEDAIFRMYSNTKPVTSVAAMQLHQQGLFGLDDPVAAYLPAFSDMVVLIPNATAPDQVEPAREPIRIRHLLSHSAGLSYQFVEPTSLIDRIYAEQQIVAFGDGQLTLEGLCDRLAAQPLAYQPGTRWRYSFATDVVARLVEVVSGRRFDDYLERHIFEPLGMVDTGFWVPPDKQHRFVTMYAPTELQNPMAPGLVRFDDPQTGIYSRPRDLLSGGGGLVSTAADYLTFMRMVINGGSWHGERILAPESLRLMRTNQLPPGVRVQFAAWQMPGTTFGLGFALKEAVTADEPPAMLGEYHWGGMAGTHSWWSPAAGIAGLCMTQRMPGFWHPFSHDFKDLAYRIAAP